MNNSDLHDTLKAIGRTPGIFKRDTPLLLLTLEKMQKIKCGMKTLENDVIMDVHTADIFTISLTDSLLAEIISMARLSESAAKRGDEMARVHFARELKKVCRKQYS